MLSVWVLFNVLYLLKSKEAGCRGEHGVNRHWHRRTCGRGQQQRSRQAWGEQGAGVWPPHVLPACCHCFSCHSSVGEGEGEMH